MKKIFSEIGISDEDINKLPLTFMYMKATSNNDKKKIVLPAYESHKHNSERLWRIPFYKNISKLI